MKDNEMQTYRKYINMDWYTMQTKIRQMVHELIKPYSRKWEEDRNTVKEVSKVNDTLKKTFDEIFFVLVKS